MPLSEYEQRVLEQLEHDLGSDPKLGQAMSRGQRSRVHLTWAVIGVIFGLAVVLGGAIAQIPVLGVAGFAAMLAAGTWGLMGGKPAPKKGAAGANKDAKGTSAPTPQPKQSKNFMGRMEDRFERRRDEGEL